MLTTGELADRAAITDVLTLYSTALRTKELDRLDAVFTPDAVIDYRAIGGERTGVVATKAWLATFLEGVHYFQLMVGSSEFEFASDRASARVVSSWHGVFVPKSGPALIVFGTYDDEFSHDQRWAIRVRVDHPRVQLVAQLASPS